jgi:metal-responsive CopG/Arc/MetJ family transcriptional regulator
MKITISMPDEVYNKLEEDRGLIPRSTYIQKIIKESGSVEGLEEVEEEKDEDAGATGEEFKTYFKK